MSRRASSVNPPFADTPADVTVSAPRLLAAGYRSYERYSLTLRGAGGASLEQQRDILRGGLVSVVIPVDLKRGEVVLIRQFRLAAHLGNGRGELIETVAGRLDAGERPVDAALRECREEIGITPSRLVELFSFFPTPGVTDEHVTVFLAAVDAAQVPERTGNASEAEDIRLLRVGIAQAIAALEEGKIHSGVSIIALQWLALNRDRLAAILGR